MFTEIPLRRGFDAITGIAQEVVVEVRFQDQVFGCFFAVFLAHLIFKLQRQIPFLELTLPVLIGGQHQFLDHLLGDGRTAFCGTAGAKVCHTGTNDTFQVNAAVAVETPVLDGHDSILQILRHIIDGNGITLLRCMDIRDFLTGIQIIDRGSLAVDRQGVKIDLRCAVQHAQEGAKADSDSHAHDSEHADTGDPDDPQNHLPVEFIVVSASRKAFINIILSAEIHSSSSCISICFSVHTSIMDADSHSYMTLYQKDALSSRNRFLEEA